MRTYVRNFFSLSLSLSTSRRTTASASLSAERRFLAHVAIFLVKSGEIGGPVAFIIDVEDIYRSRAWWTNVEKGGEEAQ